MKKSLILLASIMFVFIISGCMMTSKYHITDSPVLQEDESGGVNIKCTYIDRNEIIKRHGTKHNPFLAPPNILTPQPIFIFELEITNLEEAPIKLDQRKLDFYYNNKSYTPMSRLKMEMKIKDEVSKGSEKIIQERIVKKYMFKDIEKIQGYQTVKKYIIYMKNLKDRGEAELIIPLFTKDDFDAAEFTFYYDFKIKK